MQFFQQNNYQYFNVYESLNIFHQAKDLNNLGMCALYKDISPPDEWPWSQGS